MIIITDSMIVIIITIIVTITTYSYDWFISTHSHVIHWPKVVPSLVTAIFRSHQEIKEVYTGSLPVTWTQPVKEPAVWKWIHANGLGEKASPNGQFAALFVTFQYTAYIHIV